MRGGSIPSWRSLLDQVSFDAPDLADKNVTIDEPYVQRMLGRHRRQRRLVALHPVMRFRVRVIATAALLLAGCGKKGPPLAPLHLIPGPPTALEIRRTGSEARLNLVLPAGNVNGGGPSVLDRVQIYAVTLAPGMAPPPNRELLTPKFLVGTIAVKPPPVEGEPAPAADAPPDPRPSAGDKATFVETLTAPKLAPVAPGTETAAAAATSRRAAGTALLTAAIAAIPPRTAGVPLVAAATATPTTGPAAFATSFAIAASAAVTAAIPSTPSGCMPRRARRRVGGRDSRRPERSCP